MWANTPIFGKFLASLAPRFPEFPRPPAARRRVHPIDIEHARGGFLSCSVFRDIAPPTADRQAHLLSHNPELAVKAILTLTSIGLTLVLGAIGPTARAQDPSPVEPASSTAEPPQAQAKQPNILVIWGDDIGIWTGWNHC